MNKKHLENFNNWIGTLETGFYLKNKRQINLIKSRVENEILQCKKCKGDNLFITEKTNIYHFTNYTCNDCGNKWETIN